MEDSSKKMNENKSTCNSLDEDNIEKNCIFMFFIMYIKYN